MSDVQPWGDVVRPLLAVLPPKMATTGAAIMLLAIGKQESDWKHRQQIGGPARSFMQFETAGVRGVLTHAASSSYAAALCRLRDVPATVPAVHEAMLTDDILGAGFGRLLLWTDPKPLPVAGDIEGGWQLYLRTWRPGKPRRQHWDACYQWASEQIR